MARREIFVDDLDGKESESVQTRRFSIGRQGYTIDLSDDNYEQFLKDFDKYVSVAVKEEAPSRAVRASAPRRSSGATSDTDKGYTAADVREWAAAEGIEVSARGRIHREVIEKFEYAKGLDKK